jgi:hypothetical protein
MEKSHRKAAIVKTYEGYHAYRDMILYYTVKNLIAYLRFNNNSNFDTMQKALKGPRVMEWGNLGGQLVPDKHIDQLRADIGSGRLACWDDIHKRYDALWQAYPLEKQKHAFAALCDLYGKTELTRDQWSDALNQAVGIQEYVRDQVYASRKKDYDNSFRQATFRSSEEMIAAIGVIDDNSFVKQVRTETEEFKQQIAEILKRG